VASPLRLLLVSEDAIARAGLRALAERAGVSVVADLAPDELELPLVEAADAILWDAGATGAFEAIRGAAGRVPVLALPWNAEQAREALAAGARGVLSRERLEEQLPAALQAAVLGLLVVDEAEGASVIRAPAMAIALVEPLTPRETEVLQLLAQGLTNRRIGERLGISEHTAKFHVNAILGKLDAQTRGEAIAHAARLGLLLL
jgi:two-component system, NarL family, nitrate/nitrite response regulator NarL